MSNIPKNLTFVGRSRKAGVDASVILPRHPNSSQYLVRRCLEPLKASLGDVWGFKYLLKRCLDVILGTVHGICILQLRKNGWYTIWFKCPVRNGIYEHPQLVQNSSCHQQFLHHFGIPEPPEGAKKSARFIFVRFIFFCSIALPPKKSARFFFLASKSSSNPTLTGP